MYNYIEIEEEMSMRKVMEWNPEYIRVLMSKMQMYFMETYFEDPHDFLDDEGMVYIDYDMAIEAALESVLQAEDLEGFIEAEDFGHLIDMVTTMFDYKFFDEIEKSITETLQDEKMYRADQLGYHGMRRSDFI